MYGTNGGNTNKKALKESITPNLITNSRGVNGATSTQLRSAINKKYMTPSAKQDTSPPPTRKMGSQHPPNQGGSDT